MYSDDDIFDVLDYWSGTGEVDLEDVLSDELNYPGAARLLQMDHGVPLEDAVQLIEQWKKERGR